jgi:GNAT superfamily N-acetyltransferase
MQAEDESFLHDTWARSYQRSPSARIVSSKLFYQWHRHVRNAILARSTTLVLRDPDDPTYIYGYIVAEPIDDALVVHWAYIRSSERGAGHGYRLLDAALALHPHATKLLYTHRTYFANKAESLGFHFAKLKELSYAPE